MYFRSSIIVISLLATALAPHAARSQSNATSPAPAVEASYHRIIALLEDEITALESSIASLTSERRREMNRLVKTRSTNAVLEGRLADLTRRESRAEHALAETTAEQQRLAEAVRATRKANPELTALTIAQQRIDQLKADEKRLAAAADARRKAEATALAERVEHSAALERTIHERQATLTALSATLAGQRAAVEKFAAQPEAVLAAAAQDAQQKQQGALTGAEAKLAEIRAQIAAGHEALTGQAGRRATLGAELASLSEALAESKAELTAVRTQLGQQETAMTGLTARRAALQAEIQQLTSGNADRARDLKQSVQRKEAVLQQTLAATEALAGIKQTTSESEVYLAKLAQRITSAEADLAKVQKQQGDAWAKAEAQHVAQAQAALAHADLTADVAQLEQDKVRLSEELARLSERRAGLRKEIDGLSSGSTSNRQVRPQVTAAVAPMSTTPTRALRPAALVAEALIRAPGLPPEGSAERDRLRDLLTDGTCPTEALRETMPSINRQTLVSLVRSLGAC